MSQAFKTWSVYLSGEIHTSWRDEIRTQVESRNLPFEFFGPITDHSASDDCGVAILGEEIDEFWKDHKGAKINAIRTRTLIEQCDIVIVRFGEKYRQWNAAFDAGYAVALGKPLVSFHPAEFNHALKELDAAALAVCESVNQVVGILGYVANGELSRTNI